MLFFSPRVYNFLVNASQRGWGWRWWCLHSKYISAEVVLQWVLYTPVHMVRLKRVFLFYASGLASSRHRVWLVGVFYLMEVHPLQKVKPWLSVGLPSPCEKRGRADVVRARSEWIITQISYGLVWVVRAPLNTSLSLSLRSFPQTRVAATQVHTEGSKILNCNC